MFYEERIIDGIMHSRGTPDGAFEPMGQRMLTTLLLAARGRVKELEDRNKAAGEEAAFYDR